ncbi:MAG: hypothetical protein KDK75_00180 [Alphaproteobacteria bacterium]|nr:hypothetical protein [Alphaproteobacteria bacterium]
MAVSIPSDLVVDVMKAADPARLRQAVAKLSKAVEGEDAGAMSFQSALTDTHSKSCLNILPAREVPPPQVDRRADTTRQGFEQIVWRTLYETVLPDEQAGVFGGGPSAGIWRSMAADQLAAVASKHTNLGVLSSFDGGRSTTPREMITSAPLSGWPYFSTSQIRSYAG